MQLALDTHFEKIKIDVESQLLQKARVYQRSLAEGYPSKDRGAMSVLLESQRAEISSLKGQSNAQGPDSELISRMRQDIDDLRNELQRSLEAVADNEGQRTPKKREQQAQSAGRYSA